MPTHLDTPQRPLSTQPQGWPCVHTAWVCIGPASVAIDSLTEAQRLAMLCVSTRYPSYTGNELNQAASWGLLLGGVGRCALSPGALELLSHCNSLGHGSAPALDSPHQSSCFTQHCALTALYFITQQSYETNRHQAERFRPGHYPLSACCYWLWLSTLCLQISHSLGDKISHDKASIWGHFLIMHTKTHYTSAYIECVHSVHWSILFHFSILLTRI